MGWVLLQVNGLMDKRAHLSASNAHVVFIEFAFIAHGRSFGVILSPVQMDM